MGAARIRSLTSTVKTFQSENKKTKAELAENLKEKAFFSEKETTKDMIDGN